MVSPSSRRVSAAESFYRDLLGLNERSDGALAAWSEEAQPDPPTPAGLTLVDHSHFAAWCHRGKTWVPGNAAAKMSPSRMDPGFLTSTGKLQFDDRLDKSLIDLLVDDAEYKTFLAPESITKRWPSQNDRIRVCLVDLSKGKSCRPGYAGWGSTYEMRGSSTAKVAIIYAAHQIVFDLRQMATSQGITSVAALQTFAHATPWSALKCKPRVDRLVTVDASGVIMSPALTAALEQIVFGSDGNRNANNTLLNIGFEYVASLLWQSGLRHPDVKGLWYSNSYQAAKDVALDPACHSSSNGIVFWTKDPLKGGGIMLSARSVATFFTLLAQRRLADRPTSIAIEALLKQGCAIEGALFDALPSGAVRAAKCGTASGFVHDAALIRHDGLNYVMVYLTKSLPMTKALRTRLIRDFDGLIRANNP
jgi:Beta-lactamase enzyme family